LIKKTSTNDFNQSALSPITFQNNTSALFDYKQQFDKVKLKIICCRLHFFFK